MASRDAAHLRGGTWRARSGDEHGGAADRAGAQLRKRLVCLLEREFLHLGADRHARSEREELLAVAAGQVRDRAHDALAPEQLVGERRDVAHVDPGADHGATLADMAERCGHELESCRNAHGFSCRSYWRTQRGRWRSRMTPLLRQWASSRPRCEAIRIRFTPTVKAKLRASSSS